MKIVSKVKQYDPSENKLFLDYTAQSEYAKFLLERKAIKLRAVWKGHTASIEIATVESILCDRHTDLKLQEQHSIVISAPRSVIKLLPEDFESEGQSHPPHRLQIQICCPVSAVLQFHQEE